jgi:hypothetical protein
MMPKMSIQCQTEKMQGSPCMTLRARAQEQARGPSLQATTLPGAITGQYIDGNFANHGFLRNQQGAFSIFDVPGTGTGADQGTIPLGNNNPGAITGEYIDGNNVICGFLVQGLYTYLKVDKISTEAIGRPVRAATVWAGQAPNAPGRQGVIRIHAA